MESQIVTEEFSLLLENYKLHIQKQLNVLKTKIEYLNERFYNKTNYKHVNERLDNMEKGIVSLKLKNEKDLDKQTKYLQSYLHSYCTVNSMITVLVSCFLVSVMSGNYF
jgi:hypothetical protein